MKSVDSNQPNLQQWMWNTKTLGPRGFYFASSAAWNALPVHHSAQPWTISEQIQNWIETPLVFSWPNLGYIYHLICSSYAPTRYFISLRVQVSVLNWIELNWIELNWIELNWIELNSIELNWIELNWIDIISRSTDIPQTGKPWTSPTHRRSNHVLQYHSWSLLRRLINIFRPYQFQSITWSPFPSFHPTF